MTPERRAQRRERLLSLPDAPKGQGWKVMRRDGEVSIEVLVTYSGDDPSPTAARAVIYGPRGGLRYVAAGDEKEIERQRGWLDLLSQAIYEIDRP